ncbi:ABC transporter permease [Chelatococcus asaccharovorans]|uniref:ABC transporter permease n=1 Tax=Chelatococcus asaccharovorans TaxID=28210 RepID=UPI00224C6A5C|nr:ABC transporter permease [Chelatococcus asaccharovorans]CAH1673146.1 putative peptide ABC transporter permease protein y4tQ [Chelatococcus asaccharovorans]CAH1675433.1 putative peptide ABC transporter permease protein y4tQ [Chelatococcus asaccharovorans]
MAMIEAKAIESTTIEDKAAGAARSRGRAGAFRHFLGRNPVILTGVCLLVVFMLIAAVSPYLLPDPTRLDPSQRLRPPSLQNWFGTDHLGRSVLSRTLNGTSISLAAGTLVMVLTTLFGVFLGLVSGFFRKLDGILMRFMDGVMAIPGILLAIALMSLFGSSLQNVVVAIAIVEVPRMARVVRACVLVLRDQPYVEASITLGTRMPRLLVREILPNIAAPVLVQATYVFAAAMVVESVLSFLGAGTPPTIPSWGNMLAEGRQYLQRAPWIAAFPGVFLAVLILTVNVLGDALRDALDPKLSRRRR